MRYWSSQSADGAQPASGPAPLAALDDWMRQSPWPPRLLPYALYLLLLAGIQLALAGAEQLGQPWVGRAAYPLLYVVQCGAVAWLLWRYRRLLPEMTLRFHWLAVPTAVGLCAAWIALGWWMAGEFGERWTALLGGEPLGAIDYTGDGAGEGGEPAWLATTEPHLLEQIAGQSRGLYWTSLGLRLLGMTLLVPLFEELFVRSACLRGMHSARKTGAGLLQLLEDVPVVGEWLITSRWGLRLAKLPPMFTQQFREWPVGALTVFGVTASTLVFTVGHGMRDWPGAVVCALVWCGLLWWTNRPGEGSEGRRKLGLGPIAWSHGLTNALLWGYTVYTGDWQFL